MKILQIGCGGIGGELLPEIVECIKQGQLNAEITIADDDMVELNQLRYQNFPKRDIGDKKVMSLGRRYLADLPKGNNPKVLHHRITVEAELENFDIIILCVDNEPARELVVRYCHKHNKEFLDLRATGSRIFAMPKTKELKDNMKFIDTYDLQEYSCQDKADLKKGHIQKGHKIVAMMGIQMLLNIVRNRANKIISMVI